MASAALKSIVPQLDHLRLAEFLNALDGTAYCTDLDGRLASVGHTNWNHFATENGGRPLAETHPIGRPLAEVVSGEMVRSFYQRAHKVAVSGERRVSFMFRCDAPDVERRMKMSISPLRVGKEVVGVLYQSTILAERTRPPMRFLDVSEALEQYKRDSVPLVTVCSFCAKIDWPIGTATTWVEPEDYYRSGGASEVRISHGVCPHCAEGVEQLVS